MAMRLSVGWFAGRGWTQPGGRPHAEAIALAAAGDAAVVVHRPEIVVPQTAVMQGAQGRFVWTVDFLPDGMAGMQDASMEAGVAAMAGVLG